MRASRGAPPTDPIDAMLRAHGLRCTAAARLVLEWFVSHPAHSFTHAQLLESLQASHADAGLAAVHLDRVTLYRLVDRLTLAGLLLCRVDARRVRHYQAMPESVKSIAHFECQNCHRDRPLAQAVQGEALDLQAAAQNAMHSLQALGYQDIHLDLAVRGVCADCASAKVRPPH